MKKLNLAKAFQLTCGCQSTATVLDPTQITWIEGPDDVLAPSLRATLVTHYSEVLEFCRTFELPVSEASCVEIIKLLDSEQTSKGRWLHSPTRELVKRIQVELQSKLFLYVPSQNGPFYQEPLAGWEKTTSALPSAIFDIQEASKCLALQRNTACVFHLMRVMGSGWACPVFSDS